MILIRKFRLPLFANLFLLSLISPALSVQYSVDGLKLGENIGLLSYDDTPIKEILDDSGITTISNNFAQFLVFYKNQKQPVLSSKG